MEEWSLGKKWNPFNSYKLLSHVYRWRQIERGKAIPQPPLISIDPINMCNLGCNWCNAEFILKKNNRRINRETLMDLADFLPRWQGSPEWPGGVEAICIAGGGEPLLHPDIGSFIERTVANGIEVGVITNGTNLDELLVPLSKCTWVGVSVDAGTTATFKRLKQADLFDRVVDNIQQLIAYAASHDCRLGSGHPGHGVSYKYLLSPDNNNDIIPAARLAKKLGCKNFHLRPAAIAWDKLSSKNRALFKNREAKCLAEAIETVRPLEDKTFGVYGITHKLADDLNSANSFNHCHAIFMTCVIMPPRDESRERFRLGFCCDRRGDLKLEAAGVGESVEEISGYWGTADHWAIFDSLNPANCPRCTYQPHNLIMEHVILEDSMTYKFI